MLTGAAWVYCYLYVDDQKLAFTTDYESVYPPPPRAEESFALLRQIGAKHLTQPTPENFGIVDETPEAEIISSHILGLETAFEDLHELPAHEKRERIQGLRDCIDFLWDSVTEDRAILKQLASFDAIADLSRVDQLAFGELAPGHYRNLARIFRFKALLLFADGRIEEATELLVGFIETNRNLLPQTRHAITGLTCIASDAILNHAIKETVPGLSDRPDLKHKIISSLRIDYDPISILERWVLSELIGWADYYDSLGKQGLKFFGTPNAMPRDSVNQMARFFQTHMELLKNTSVEAAMAQAEAYKQSMEGFHLRNQMGRNWFSSSTIVPAKFLTTFQAHEKRVQGLIASLDR